MVQLFLQTMQVQATRDHLLELSRLRLQKRDLSLTGIELAYLKLDEEVDESIGLSGHVEFISSIPQQVRAVK